ncbi:MAG TPA: diaminopimelate decarboxylase [Kofleriaceae bacterium]|nr:diaminopimelate decarboxylase [Kofleriaceae bacterium]
MTSRFDYADDSLCCEGVPLAAIADQVGTPVYVYSRGAIEAAYRAYDDALDGVPHLVCYSVKANSSIGILSVLARLGAGADIVSGGELYRWRKAGGDPGKVVFSGVGKTEAEMAAALEAGILAFNVESAEELDVLDRVARAAGVRAPVSLRVNPDVDPQTHPYISTGLKQNKFGIAAGAARDVFHRAADKAGVQVRGIDCHIGSQLTRTAPFADAIARLCELVLGLAADGLRLELIDIGGGLGIDYGKAGDAPPPTHGEYGATVQAALAPLADLRLRLLVEPGRSIVGPAGALVTRVLYRKQGEAKHFTIVDAAMNDLIRPSFYGSHHPMRPVHRTAAPIQTTDIVGPICETGDFLARDRALPALAAGDLLAIEAAGAYGFTMSSNYNTRPRAAEVLVDGDRWIVIRARETLDHLTAGERAAD